MRLCVDENIPTMTVRALRDMGHDVWDVRGTNDEGTSDQALWQKAQREKRLLITTDRGFVQHRAESHQGVLIVLLRQPDRWKIHRRVMQAMTTFGEEEWPGLLVVMRDAVRSVWQMGKST